MRYYHTGSASTFLDINGDLGTTSWYHFVYTFNGATGAMVLYKNGVSGATGTQTGTSNPGITDQFTIGSTAQYTFTAPWNGLIDEVGVWNKVLTVQEIQVLYLGGQGLQYPFGSSFNQGQRPALFKPGNSK